MLFNFKQEGFYKKAGIRLALVLIGIVVGVGGTFLYIQKFGIPFKGLLQNVAKMEDAKVLQETTAKVGKLILLPKDETPVMATITDVNALVQKEPFYAGAVNGDVVLMYQKALKAIIYSPSRDIIVNVGPVYVPPQENAPQGGQPAEAKKAPAAAAPAAATPAAPAVKK